MPVCRFRSDLRPFSAPQQVPPILSDPGPEPDSAAAASRRCRPFSRVVRDCTATHKKSAHAYKQMVCLIVRRPVGWSTGRSDAGVNVPQCHLCTTPRRPGGQATRRQRPNRNASRTLRPPPSAAAWVICCWALKPFQSEAKTKK